MFPLALGASQSLLTQVAPGLLWVAALLSVLMSLERIFKDDLHEGLLAQWWCRGRSLVGYAAVRLLSTWLTVALPLVLLSPMMALVLGLPSAAIPILMLSLALGSGVLVAVGAVGSALTTGLPKAGILLALIVLPFYIPVLIFGASSVAVVSVGLSGAGQVYVLAALWVLSVVLAPFAIGAALKIGVSQA
jgi:heme exporter protein B